MIPKNEEEPQLLLINHKARLLIQIHRESVLRDVLVFGIQDAHPQIHEVVRQRRHGEHCPKSAKQRPHFRVIGLIVKIDRVPKGVHFAEHFSNCHWHFAYN